MKQEGGRDEDFLLLSFGFLQIARRRHSRDVFSAAEEEKKVLRIMQSRNIDKSGGGAGELKAFHLLLGILPLPAIVHSVE
jgi:hypothetical protein